MLATGSGYSEKDDLEGEKLKSEQGGGTDMRLPVTW